MFAHLAEHRTSYLQSKVLLYMEYIWNIWNIPLSDEGHLKNMYRHQYELMVSFIQIQMLICIEIFINMCVYTQVSTHTHISLFCGLSLETMTTQQQQANLLPRVWFLIPSSCKETPWKKQLIQGLSVANTQVILEYLVLLESKEALKQKTKHTTMGICQKDTRTK